VIEVDVEEMAITRRFNVGGKPVRLAAIGLLEEMEEGEDHDHAAGFEPRRRLSEPNPLQRHDHRHCTKVATTP
jgi:hypothetical protein